MDVQEVREVTQTHPVWLQWKRLESWMKKAAYCSEQSAATEPNTRKPLGLMIANIILCGDDSLQRVLESLSR